MLAKTRKEIASYLSAYKTTSRPPYPCTISWKTSSKTVELTWIRFLTSNWQAWTWLWRNSKPASRPSQTNRWGNSQPLMAHLWTLTNQPFRAVWWQRAFSLTNSDYIRQTLSKTKKLKRSLSDKRALPGLQIKTWSSKTCKIRTGLQDSGLTWPTVSNLQANGTLGRTLYRLDEDSRSVAIQEALRSDRRRLACRRLLPAGLRQLRRFGLGWGQVCWAIEDQLPWWHQPQYGHLLLPARFDLGCVHDSDNLSTAPEKPKKSFE